MLRKRTTMTVDKITANHANGQKSRGRPKKAGARRARGNDFTPSIYVQSLRDTMITLGEDPVDFAQFLQKLILEHRPATPTEMMLIEDIALLEWERRRADRAQFGLLAQRVEKAEMECVKRTLELGNEAPAQYNEETRRLGLRRAPDSRTKFDELMDWIEFLVAKAKKRELDGIDTPLKFLYGKEPSWHGREVLGFYEQLREPPAAPEPDAEQAASRERTWKEFYVALLREQRNIFEEVRCYMTERLELSPSMRNALLAPNDMQWTLIIRQKNSVDRRLERKLRLLLELQRSRRTTEALRRASVLAGAA